MQCTHASSLQGKAGQGGGYAGPPEHKFVCLGGAVWGRGLCHRGRPQIWSAPGLVRQCRRCGVGQGMHRWGRCGLSGNGPKSVRRASCSSASSWAMRVAPSCLKVAMRCGHSPSKKSRRASIREPAMLQRRCGAKVQCEARDAAAGKSTLSANAMQKTAVHAVLQARKSSIASQKAKKQST